MQNEKCKSQSSTDGANERFKVKRKKKEAGGLGK